MCEIQFYKRTDGNNLSQKDINNFIKMLEFGSIENPDAFGIFNKDVTFRKTGLVDMRGLDIQQLKNSSWVVGHNRLATSGKPKHNHNNHPFVLNDFVMVHNGIIFNTPDLEKEFLLKGGKVQTDSYIFLKAFVSTFNISQEKNREKRVTEALKKVLKETRGSISIFLYDKVGDGLYYFKDNGTYFNFISLDGLIIGTTDDTKLFYSYDKGMKYKDIDIDDYYIYKIENTVKKLDKFKMAEAVGGYYLGQGYSNARDLDSWRGYDFDMERGYISDGDKEDIEMEVESCFHRAFGTIPQFRLDDKARNIIIRDEHLTDNLKTFLNPIMTRNVTKRTNSIGLNEFMFNYGY